MQHPTITAAAAERLAPTGSEASQAPSSRVQSRTTTTLWGPLGRIGRTVAQEERARSVSLPLSIVRSSVTDVRLCRLRWRWRAFLSFAKAYASADNLLLQGGGGGYGGGSGGAHNLGQSEYTGSFDNHSSGGGKMRIIGLSVTTPRRDRKSVV